jgi:ubiquitin-conjugating enzyme E2 N
MDRMNARIIREAENLNKGIAKGDYTGITFEVIGENPRHLKLFITGPHDTPYEGGTFEFRIFYDEKYPTVPPHVKLQTKIYHPNINGLGQVCLNILKPDGWSPVIQLTALAMSLRGLLESPNTDDPLDVNVNKHFLTKPDDAKKMAKEMTAKFAM